MNFDQVVNRVGTKSAKWDGMERAFGVAPGDGIAMWIADMDFAAPAFLSAAAQRYVDTGNYGYFTGMDEFHEAVAWWMKTRHGWQIERAWTFVTFGLGHGIATTLMALTERGDHIATFTPVYHEFQRKIEAAGRINTQLPLAVDDAGLYYMDFDAYEALMTGKEKLLLISSPHNPAGRVWTQDELSKLAAFCQKHDLILVSDEIHHDLVFPGHQHKTAALAMPEILDRLVVTCAASKTFNIAGARTGCVIIPDPALRKRFADYYGCFDINANGLGVALTCAAYSPEGAAWVDELTAYLAGNFEVFKAELADIPGATVMPMQSTYLSWVDFSGTGLGMDEVNTRVYKQAKIAATPGVGLGRGGENFLRFNLGTRSSLVAEAAARLKTAFGV
ncbi:PatB family C-S lyase [Cognatishimia sp. SS12]|uniref:MalY/PatB family protein n=1 Tax=Cognatishimia sp. SS12 TaxID=2979465 RepID=UPI00232FC95F|nr:PatB family C-S lyase [Cognatishimia sp. SS12]MDC0739243.1 PatB family C-S lyase [Cognatishimia sp. SS12]